MWQGKDSEGTGRDYPAFNSPYVKHSELDSCPYQIIPSGVAAIA
jgi:hypothetical protein